MKKLILFVVFISNGIIGMAQTSTTINVGGDADKYYPVSFSDAEWNNNVYTDVNIGRSNVHLDGSWRGSIIANFKYHVTNYGHGSSFLNTTIYGSDFIAGWTDATANNAANCVLIWLKGGGLTYMINSKSSLTMAVYDGLQNALPYQEANGPSRSFKTSIDQYVNPSGSSMMGSAYFSSNGIFFGNVGIGTTTPREKLSVNGNIRAREIKVEATNWPDYVFEEGYKVETLEGLESYIKANKHLPDMPTSKEIETNGLELGETVKMQQKKIEELTLHLIEKNKQLQNEGSLIKNQQLQINELKKGLLEIKEYLSRQKK